MNDLPRASAISKVVRSVVLPYQRIAKDIIQKN